MKLVNEEQILDQDYRALVIKEILGPENTERKKESKKKYDIFKDGTKKYTMERMKQEIGDAFEEAKYRVANISFLRKIIDKKAMVYKDSALREVESDATKEQISSYVDWLNHNTKMKKVNKYLELFRNCLYQVAPYRDPFTDSFKVRSQVLPPHLYDVIEDAENPEIGRVFIFSYFAGGTSRHQSAPNESGLRTGTDAPLNFRSGDGHDQIIADSPDDAGQNKMEFVWWSTKFHFTTNGKGEIVRGANKGDVDNPIGMLPFTSFSKEQDGQFWAVGGDDLSDGTILLNQLLTDLYFIAKLQGQGIFYLIGPRVPESLKIGPSDAILMETKEGDPDTQIGFASSSPPIEAHMKMIEQYVALLLSTNNLEPGTVRGELSATGAASGIQEMIRMSENIDDIEDQREVYRDNEPEIFKIITAWHNLLLDRGVAHDDLKSLGMIDPTQKVSLSFPAPKRFMTDKDRLDIIQKRRELNLDSSIDSLMRDNLDLSREEAELKFQKILEDKLQFNSMKLLQQVNPDKGDIDQGKDENKDALDS